MDCNMPFMDGYECTDKIRTLFYKHKLEQPIITAVTGHSEYIYIRKAINSGMNQVLSKPVKASLLRSLLDTLGFKLKPTTLTQNVV